MLYSQTRLLSWTTYLGSRVSSGLLTSVENTNHPRHGKLGESFVPASLHSSPTLGRPNVISIGPAPETPLVAGGKLRSRNLAFAPSISVAQFAHVESAADGRAFAKGGVEYSVMIKAPDGGGGAGRARMYGRSRGIGYPTTIKALNGEGVRDKSCQHRGTYQGGIQTMHGRKPVRPTVFREGAAWTGMEEYRGPDRGRCHGDVARLCEVQCRVQGQFQKVIEMALSTIFHHPTESSEAPTCCPVEDSAYLAISRRKHFRIPRKFAHGRVGVPWNRPADTGRASVIEELMNLDLVCIQLLLSSATLVSFDITPASIGPPQGCLIQLCLTAEDPAKDFRLSASTIPAQLRSVACGIWTRRDIPIVVSPPGSKATSAAKKRTLTLASIAHNTFPADLAGTLPSIFSPAPLVHLFKQEQSFAGVQAGALDLADPNDSTQVAVALTGTIVELHPARDEDGERVGRVVREKDPDAGAVVGEGMLLAVVALHEELNKSRL
ncbi:hypothetical protein FIBSPDRAFT_1046791 [Athelia psychrophila]|uniref:Carbamoyl-phosphate synthetase large subunit-like ATP-binding domain-containing protein n=1 Tax=Athelia psychrophila TaxID=1759441 RepID=A0A166G4E5_9AGAM|nr:hypothetical protein FIBSPDRAFT_1046791 [Fibularhizoctonia sp. CBS 109695]